MVEKWAIGVDLGGTNTKLGLVDRRGRILARARFRTRAELGPLRSLERLARAIERLKGSNRLIGVGVGVAGLVNHESGILHIPPNLPGWEGTPVKSLMEELLGVQVEVLNDVNGVALGELQYGVARGYKEVLFLTLGTGVGGAVVSRGRLSLGANQVAGELGHMVLKPDGPGCRCGQQGCLESLVGSARIVELAREGLRDQPSLISRLSRGDPARITPRMVARAARMGDPLGVRIMREIGGWVGLGVVNAVHLLDPELVVIGGGVARAGGVLLRTIQETVEAHLMKFPGRRLEIKTSRLGDDAGIVGAASILYNPQPLIG